MQPFVTDVSYHYGHDSTYDPKDAVKGSPAYTISSMAMFDSVQSQRVTMTFLPSQYKGWASLMRGNISASSNSYMRIETEEGNRLK